MSRFIVGLTGGIGSGKTTVANEFIRLGAQAVDADIVAREVVAPGSECLEAIAVKFGPEILLADGQLNRSELRAQIFADQNKKQWLNQLMHPAIRQLMLQQLNAADSPYVLLIAPLLFENGLERYTNLNVVVDVPEQVQLERTCQRDAVDHEQVKSIIASQISRQQRLAKADEIVDNDRPWPQVANDIAFLHQKFMQLSNTI